LVAIENQLFQQGCPGLLGGLAEGSNDAVDARLVQQAADTGPQCGEVKRFRDEV